MQQAWERQTGAEQAWGKTTAFAQEAQRHQHQHGWPLRRRRNWLPALEWRSHTFDRIAMRSCFSSVLRETCNTVEYSNCSPLFSCCQKKAVGRRCKLGRVFGLGASQFTKKEWQKPQRERFAQGHSLQCPGFGAKRTLRGESTETCKMLLLHASFSRNFSRIRGRSSVIMIDEKIFHLLDRSAEPPLQAALSLSVCLAPNTMMTPKSGHSEVR